MCMIFGLPPVPPAIIATAPTPVPSAVIPAGTAIAVTLSESVDSATARAGDFYRFQTIEQLKVGGKTVLPVHTTGVGIVSDAQPAGPHSRQGSLLLEARYLRLPRGGELQVIVDRKISDLRRKGASPQLPFYTSYLPIPSMGLITKAYDYVRNGKDVVLPKGAVFIVVTIQNTTVYQ